LNSDILNFSVIASPMMQHHNTTRPIIQLISVILSTGSTSKASKKRG